MLCTVPQNNCATCSAVDAASFDGCGYGAGQTGALLNLRLHARVRLPGCRHPAGLHTPQTRAVLRAHAQTPPTALFCEVQRCASGSQSGFVFHPHSESNCCCYLSVWRSRASFLFDSRPTDQWMPVVKTSHFSCAGRIITPSLAEVTSPLLFASLASPSANCWEEEGGK